jgi:hypothetical protein
MPALIRRTDLPGPPTGQQLVGAAHDIPISLFLVRFTSIGNEQLRLTAIHTASTMNTEWLTAPAIPTPDSTSVA